MKIKAIILAAVMLIMFTTGAQAARITPAESMEKVCNALFYLDDKDLQSLNFSGEEIRKNYVESFNSTNEQINFTDKQKQTMADALIDTMRKKIKFTVNTESVNGDKAVVAVTITGIKFNETMNDISFDATGLTAEQISEVVVQKMIEKLENVPLRQPVTVKFNCAFDEEMNLWVPEGESENNLTPLFDAALN